MQHLWDSALATLRSRLSEENFRTWLEPIELDRLDGRTVVLRIPNRFYADWISTHYLDLILESLRHAGLDLQNVDWLVDEQLQKRMDEEARQQKRADDRAARESGARDAGGRDHGDRDQGGRDQGGRGHGGRDHSGRDHGGRDHGRDSGGMGRGLGGQGSGGQGSGGQGSGNRGSGAASASPPPSDLPADSGLNPKYRFDNFIVGPSNQLAHAASMAAASSPGTRYNPLFIYGGVGLGKTHLVNAIGHRVRQDQPDARVLFLSAERFTNEFIWALQNHRINDFRERYRTRCDVLCIDDIQFLAGREQTQEEFFHTFNALYHADRQIVVTSDVYPQQIKEMEERLVSRFQWGLVADIQAPELDTRIAILKKKAEQEHIGLADDVALLIAQQVQSNVRELEGTLLRLAVKAELTGNAIDLEFAREALGAQLPRMEKQTTVEDIQRAACEYFNVRLAELKSHRRHRAVSFPRMVAMYVCRQRLKLSYPELGDRFGGKDHTTVMSAVKKIGGLVESDEQIRTAINAIERKVGLV